MEADRELSVLSHIRRAQAEGRYELALRLSWLMIDSFPEHLREELKEDLLFGPLPQPRRGLSVRATRRKRCRFCGGSGVIAHPLMREAHQRLDPETAGEWEMDCPQCGGSGWAMSSDVSWDWPESEL